MEHNGAVSLHHNSREVVPSRYGGSLTPGGFPQTKSNSSGLDIDVHDKYYDAHVLSVSKPSTGRWVPPHYSREIKDKNEIICRRVRGILNKLTPEKFDKLVYELLNVGIDSKDILNGVILLIFEKALDEPKYSNLYAQLCLRFSYEAPNFDDISVGPCSFLRLLLSKCQEEFESRSKASADFDRRSTLLTAKEQDEKSTAKRKMLGNIKFIGELGKLGLVQESILHKCVQQLLFKKKHTTTADMSEDIECLCQIMGTVGSRLDVPKAKNIMGQYFERMETLSSSPDFPARIRFMLQEVLELREQNWVSRRAFSDGGLRSVSQMRMEAFAKRYPNAPIGHYVFGADGRPIGNVDSTMSRTEPIVHDMKDIFGKEQQINKIPMSQKVQQKPDLFEPHYLKSKSSGRSINSDPQANAKPLIASKSQASQRFEIFKTDAHVHARPKEKTTTAPSHPPPGSKSVWNTGFNTTSQSSGFMFERNDRPPKTESMNSYRAPPTEHYRPYARQVPEAKPFHQFNRNPYTSNGEISLRPASSLAAKALRHENDEKPSMMNKNEKAEAKKGLSESEYKTKVGEILTKFLDDKDDVSAFDSIKMLKAAARLTKHLVKELIQKASACTADDKIQNKAFQQLLLKCFEENIFAASLYFQNFFMQCEGGALKEKTDFAADTLAFLLTNECVSVGDMLDKFRNGTCYPLILTTVKRLQNEHQKDWVKNKFESFNSHLRQCLPVDQQTDIHVWSIVQDNGLQYLFPMLSLQAELTELLNLETNNNTIYKWIKESAESQLQTKCQLIRVVMLSTLDVAFSNSASVTIDNKEATTNGLTSSEDLSENEKQVLTRMKVILGKLIRDDVTLQIETVYALQSFCHSKDFPKGLLLKLFVACYELEIIEEDAYIKWKEDVNDQYPGKGKALFQVNSWLQWLETAEEEEGSDQEEAN